MIRFGLSKYTSWVILFVLAQQIVLVGQEPDTPVDPDGEQGPVVSSLADDLSY